MQDSKGYVPEPIELPFDVPNILATGADLKSAICLTKDNLAFLSPDLGNLADTEAHKVFEETIEHLQNVLNIQPEIIACDMHPDYFSTRFTLTHRHTNVPTNRIQHHHAHIAACMADNVLQNQKVIGIALDGTGYGNDGTIWGGEILLADYAGFERVAHFRQVRLPGGDAAAREPWRMALSYLFASGERLVTSDLPPLPFIQQLDRDRIGFVLQILEKRINSPLTSSCGRLFDAVAALTGLCLYNTFEGEAPIGLEKAADRGETGIYKFGIKKQPTTITIDFGPTISEIINEVKNRVRLEIISARFHNTLAEALVETCKRVDRQLATSDPSASLRAGQRPVCLSGGCFQNVLLTEELRQGLEAEGFRVYTHSRVPPNDRCIALGQAVVAACMPVSPLLKTIDERTD